VISQILTHLQELGRDKVESLKKEFGVIVALALKIEEGANHYIYTTYSLLTHPDGPQLKYGQVIADGKNVIQRIAEQDGTSTPEPLILIAALNMPFTDYQVRSHIKSLGFKTRPDKEREWIRNITPEEMLEIVLEFRNLTYDNVYYARPHSVWVNAKIMDIYAAAATCVVIAADLAPRFGKTLTALDLYRLFVAYIDLFNKSKVGTMIVSAHWLSAHSSFKDTIEKKFDITEDIEYIVVKSGCAEEAAARYKVARTAGKRVLLALSLHADEEKLENYDSLLKAINEPAFIFQDEADYGAHTDRCRAVLKPFVNNGHKNLVVLGTGSNIGRACLGANEYKAQFHGPITIDYVDLLNAKHGQGFLFDSAFIGSGPRERTALADIRNNKEIYMNRLKDLTELNYAHLELSDSVIRVLQAANPEVIPAMAKMFENRNIAQGKAFLKCVFGDECAGEINFINMNAQIRGDWQTDFPVVGLFIGGNEQITPIGNVVKYAQSANPDWKFVPLHGKITTNEEAEEYIKQEVAIAKREGCYDGLVFVSAGVGSRSFSIPNVEMIIRMIDGGSNATAVQQGLRCATPHVDKTNALIVDMCINRTTLSGFTSMLIAHAVRESKRTAQSLSTTYQRLVNGTISFWTQKNGCFVTQNNEEFIQEIRGAFQDPDVLLSRINWEEVFKSELKDVILKLKSSGQSDTEVKSLLNKTGKVLVSQPTNQTPQQKTQEELEKIKLLKHLTTLVRSVGNLYTLAPTARSFVSALEIVASNPYKAADYEFDTGISATEAIKLANADFFLDGDLDMILLTMQETREISKKCYVSSTVPRKNVKYWDLFEKEFIFIKNKTICLLLDTIEDIQYIENKNPNFGVDNKVTIVCARGHGDGYVDTFDSNKYNVISSRKFLAGDLSHMKFDVYGINPPYNVDNNPNYYIKFIKIGKELLKEGGMMAFIVPNRFLDPESNAGKSIHDYLELIKVYPNVKHYFPTIGSNVAAFIGKKTSNPSKNDIEYLFTEDNVTVTWNPEKPMPIQSTNLKSAIIVNKIFNFEADKFSPKDSTSIQNYVFAECNYGRYCHTKEKGGKKALLCHVNKEVGNGKYFEMNTLEQAELNAWFLSKSLLGRFITYCFANSKQVSWRTVRRMPIISNIAMNDEALYSYFGITQEEQDHIYNQLVNVKEQS